MRRSMDFRRLRVGHGQEAVKKELEESLAGLRSMGADPAAIAWLNEFARLELGASHNLPIQPDQQKQAWREAKRQQRQLRADQMEPGAWDTLSTDRRIELWELAQKIEKNKKDNQSKARRSWLGRKVRK